MLVLPPKQLNILCFCSTICKKIMFNPHKKARSTAPNNSTKPKSFSLALLSRWHFLQTKTGLFVNKSNGECNAKLHN